MERTHLNIFNPTTTFAYDKVGNVTQTTLPNGSFLQNTYDAAQRLTAAGTIGDRL